MTKYFLKKNNKIPSEDECLVIMKMHNMLPNIIAHSYQVKNVALAITDDLKNKNSIDRDLIIASALLHDIAKTISIKTGRPRHDLIGGEIIRDLGFTSIAEIIEAHIFIIDFKNDGPLNEKEIIHYADKRVMHDRVVTIDERVEDIKERYKKYIKDSSLFNKNMEFLKVLEKKIESFTESKIDLLLDKKKFN